MDEKLSNELINLYKISDKSKREQMLSDFYTRNNLKSTPIKVETTLYIGETNTISFNPCTQIFRDKEDPVYCISDDYFSDSNSNFNKGYYEQVDSLFIENKRISLGDENNTLFYSPELCYLLTANPQITVNKLQIIVTSKSSLHKINTCTWEKDQISINSKEYLETYVSAFSQGKSDFDKTYSKTIDNLYILNEKNTLDFVDTLKKKYYPSCSAENAIGKCWNYIENNYSKVITHQLIYDYGYYSGKVAQLEKAINDHSVVFKNFYTPFYYSEDEINENVFWRIIIELCKQKPDLDIRKDTFIKELKKLDISYEVGFRLMSYYVAELRKFIKKEDSIFQGIISNTNEYKIYIPNNYYYWIELTDDSLEFLHFFYSHIEEPQKNNLEILSKKPIQAKYYALYHWILIEMGLENQFEKNEYNKWSRKNIENFAHEKYLITNVQGFYKAFIDIDITMKTSIANSFKNYKKFIIEISKNNAKIITYLKNYPN